MGDLTGFLDRLYDLLKIDEIRKSLFIVLPIAVMLGFWVGRHFPNPRKTRQFVGGPSPDALPDPRVAELEATIEELRHKLAIGPEAVQRAREAVSMTGPGLWLTVPPKFPSNYHVIKSSIPIYTVANLKGGVGKTTIATGLASYFANPFAVAGRKRERVLLIDLDFQGSLSSMALTNSERIPNHSKQSRATLLISGKCSGAELIQMHQRVKGLDILRNGTFVEMYALPAYYDLAQAENRLMVEWLLSDRSDDIRYNLAKVLLSEEVQACYDRIIIDAPPRLTTAHVQALAASTHVLIPTILDQLSGEAVGSFVEQAVIHRYLWPHLKMIGVVGSMTELDQEQELRDYEERGIVAIDQALEQVKDRFHLRARATGMLPRIGFIPVLSELGRAAGTRIGYLDAADNGTTRKVRRAFDNLGKEVIERLTEARELKDLLGS